MEKMAWDCPKWGRKVFFRLIQTLPTFWATRILILRTFIFLTLWDPKFPDFQVPNDSSADPKQIGWRLLAEDSWLRASG